MSTIFVDNYSKKSSFTSLSISSSVSSVTLSSNTSHLSSSSSTIILTFVSPTTSIPSSFSISKSIVLPFICTLPQLGCLSTLTIISESLKSTSSFVLTLISSLYLIVSLITYFNPISGGDSVNIANLNFGLAMYILLSGMVAICAMVLPGISGSTLLLIFGLYIPIINGIKEFLHMNFTYFPALFIFGVGVLLGIALIIKLIKIALDKYRSATVYLIIGLMIGSLYAIVMGPTTLEVPKDALSFDTFSIVYFLIGGLVIIGLDRIKMFLEKKHIEG